MKMQPVAIKPTAKANSPKSDAQFYEACSEVVIYLKAHGAYSDSEANAVKALKRRIPGRSDAQYVKAVNLLCIVWDRAKDAIWRNRLPPKGKYADFSDINFDACMKELDDLPPRNRRKVKAGILGFAIFWCYLK